VLVKQWVSYIAHISTIHIFEVAEIMALVKVIRTGRKALFILPYVSVVAEKTVYMRQTFELLKIKTVGYYANSEYANHPFEEADVVMCTIEKVLLDLSM
jgi:replicative superfamily II helicase